MACSEEAIKDAIKDFMAIVENSADYKKIKKDKTRDAYRKKIEKNTRILFEIQKARTVKIPGSQKEDTKYHNDENNFLGLGVSKKDAFKEYVNALDKYSNGGISNKLTNEDFESKFLKERKSASRHIGKELAKFKVATHAIAAGVKNSTANFISKAFFNSDDEYNTDSIVFLSTNGNRKDRVVPVKNGVLQGEYKKIDKAIKAGASFVADTSTHLNKTKNYNVGEIELANYLFSKGYIRTDVVNNINEKSSYGLWTKISKTTNPTVTIGNIWDQQGIKVITTNLGGVHGAGLAKQAKIKKLITEDNKNFDSSPIDKDVLTMAVKGKEPGTRKIGKDGKKLGAFSESVTGKNVDLLKSELKKLIKYASTSEKNVNLPLAGLGFGEGNIDEILSVLYEASKFNNVRLVVPDKATILASKDDSKVRKDKTLENIEKIKDKLKEFFAEDQKNDNTNVKEINESLKNVDGDLITDKQTKDTLFTMRVKQSKGIFTPLFNFGNPFLVSDSDDKLEFEDVFDKENASAFYYEWLSENKLPSTYSGNIDSLNKKRAWILGNLDLVRNAKGLYYKGTGAKDRNHVLALIKVAEEIESGLTNRDKKLLNNTEFNDTYQEIVKKKINDYSTSKEVQQEPGSVSQDVEDSSLGSTGKKTKWRQDFDKLSDSEREKLNIWNNKYNDSDFYTIAMDSILGAEGADSNLEFNVSEERNEMFSDMIENIALSADVFDLDVRTKYKVYQTTDEFDSGEYNPKTDTITIFLGTKESNISSYGELFAHEMVHSLTTIGVSQNPKLRRKLQKFQEDTIEQLEESTGQKGYKIFLKNIQEPDAAEIDRAKYLWSYISGNPEEFLAYGTTNAALMEAIGELKESKIKFINPFKKEGEEFTKFENVMNKFIDIINKLYVKLFHQNKYTDKDGNLQVGKKPSDIMNGYFQQFMANQMALRTGQIPKDLEPDAHNDYAFLDVTGTLGKPYRKIDEKAKHYIQKFEEHFDKFKERAKRFNQDNIAGFVDGIMNTKALLWAKDLYFFTDVINTVTTDTTNPDHAWQFRMFRQFTTFSERHHVALKNTLSNTVKSDIIKNLSQEQQDGLSDIFSTDWQGLGLNLDEYADLVKDNGKILDEIDKLNKSMSRDYAIQSRDLGYYMATGVSKNGILVKNAGLIMKISDKSGFKSVSDMSIEEEQKHLAEINKLTSLYALYYLEQADRDLISSSIESDYDAVSEMSELYKTYRDKESEFFNTKNVYIEKGYILKDQVEQYTFDIATEEDFNKRGVYKYSKHDGEVTAINDFIDSDEKHMLVVKRNFESAKSKGVLDDIGMIDRKTNINDLYIGRDFGYETRQELTDSKFERGQSDFIKDANKEGNEVEFTKDFMSERSDHMIPIVNINGNINDYEIKLSKAQRKRLMKENQGIASILGTTISHIDTKSLALENNITLIDKVIEESNKHAGERGWIKLDGDNPRYGEKWGMIPDYVKKRIKESTGEDHVWVERSFMNNFLGYKDTTIANAALFGASLKDFPEIRDALQALEKGFSELFTKYKTIIVKYMPEVVFSNATSNMFVAMRHGVQPNEYVTSFLDAWNDLTDYDRVQDELDSYIVLQSSGRKGLEGKIEALEKTLRENPMRDLVVDGQHGTIVEEVDFRITEKKEHVEAVLDKLLDSLENKIGTDKISSIRKSVYITKETTIAKAIEKLTSFNDISNRKVIMDKLSHDLDSKVEKGTELHDIKKQEILDYLDQLFANYSYLDPKFLKYLNNIGALIFTKFFLRIAKGEYRAFKRNPLNLAMFESFDAFILDVADPTDQYSNLFKTVDNKTFSANPLQVLAQIVEPRLYTMATN